MMKKNATKRIPLANAIEIAKAKANKDVLHVDLAKIIGGGSEREVDSAIASW